MLYSGILVMECGKDRPRKLTQINWLMISIGKWVPLPYTKGTTRSKRLLEGYMQKGWIIMLQMLIHISLSRFSKKVKYSLVGVGDNQVIQFTIKKGFSWTAELQRETHTAMIKDMKRVGLKLKPEETYWTKHLMEFLKVTSVDGVRLSSRLKRMLTLEF